MLWQKQEGQWCGCDVEPCDEETGFVNQRRNCRKSIEESLQRWRKVRKRLDGRRRRGEWKEAARGPVNNGRVGRIYKEMMGSKEIIAKDRQSNGGKDKGKGKMERTNVKGLLSGTPGSDGLSVRGDEMRTSHG